MLEARPGNMIFIGSGRHGRLPPPRIRLQRCGDPAWRVVLGAPRRDRDAGMTDRCAGDRHPVCDRCRGASSPLTPIELPAYCSAEVVNSVPLIGIGGRLTAPPLPHHLAYGSRTSAVRPG